MKSHLMLGAAGLASILLITLIVVTLLGPSHTGMLSERLCPAGTVSVYRASPPLYPGGPAEQLNIVCVPADQPIAQEFPYFEHRHVPNFDRFRQDPYTRRYD